MAQPSMLRGLSFKLINIKVVKSDSKTNEMLHIRLTDSNIDIILIYCSPDLAIEPTHLQYSNRRTLILGDFNIKCPYINPKSYSFNATGRTVEERLDDGLVLLNDDSATHKSGSILDLQLSTIDLASDLASFHTADGTLSDHLMTISQFNINAPKPYYLRPDWKQFKRKVAEFTNSTDELDEKAIELATHIKRCYDDYLRPQRRSSNKEIANLIKTKHRIQRRVRKLRRNGLRGDMDERELTAELNRVSKQLTRTIRLEKQQQENKLIEQLNDNKNCQNFWKAFHRLNKDNQHSTNRLKMTTQEAANSFANSLQQTMVTHRPETTEASDHQEEVERSIDEAAIDAYETPREHWQTDVRPQLLRRLISERKNTAPGDDQVSYKILKQLPDNIIENLCELIQESLKRGKIPTCWKKAKVCMLPKPGKDHTNIKNYRPLSLTSCIGKLGEIIVKEHLIKHCEDLNVFGNTQGAYRAKRSTVDNLLCLTQHAFSEALWKRSTAAVFLDVQQAFDAVWHKGLLYRLQENKVPMWIIKWTKDYLKNRELKVVYQQAVAESFVPSAGVPQGGVISPVLFNIYVSKPEVATANVSQYADDIALHTTNATCKAATLRLQRALDTLDHWCNLWKIKLNPDKTHFMLITRLKDKQQLLTLKGAQLKTTKKTTFLGAEISDSLTWTEHINKVEQKVFARTNGLKILKAKGISSKSLIKLYKMTIRPIMEYASPAWANASNSLLQRLQILQNRALKTALDLPPWTSTTEVHSRANIPTMTEYLTRRNINYLKQASKYNSSIRELIQDEPKTVQTDSNLRTPIQTILFQTALERLSISSTDVPN